MELPAEIRLKILRELLCTPEPLKVLREASDPANIVQPWSYQLNPPSWEDEATGTNYTLYPEILAVCRKLNEEGSPVLYEENTVVASYNPIYPYGPRFEWMGYLPSLASISESLSARARKLRITVEVRNSSYVASKAAQRAVRKLVKVLRETPQWRSLDVRLEDHIPNLWRDIFPSNEEDEICRYEEILRPLHLLRRLQHIEFTGVSPQFAAELSELAKSDRPTIELEKMYDSLKAYAYGSINDNMDDREVFSEEDMKLAEDAMETDNVTDFYKYRDRVIWGLDKFLRKQRADAFKNDPDPIHSRLSNLEFIAEQDRLENLESEEELVEAL
jgi:hypothetical protein